MEDGLPGGFAIERSITVAAPAATVFDLISDLRHWERWNPNGQRDPKIVRAYGGAPSGVGATAAWRGPRSGAGTLEITSATPLSSVVVRVDFERPFKARNLNRFDVRSDGLETQVTWSMRGPKPLLVRIVGLVVNVDAGMARHFEQGLAALKAIAEAR